jgi:hypothetical protein
MSYLVCEECGKSYKLDEGKSSFSYEKCECGGKLTYTDNLSGKNHYKSPKNSRISCNYCGAENTGTSTKCLNCGQEFASETAKKVDKPLSGSISWFGVAVGFGFLLIGTLLGVLFIFGTNIPQNVEDIQYNLLMAFGTISMVLAVISGLISSYIGGSISIKNGVINGGLVGVILGLIVGVTSGSLAFLGVIAIFGSLTILGGLFGTLLKRRM